MLYTKEIPYVYPRDSIYYFNRRIPKDLQRHYRCDRIIVSLHTKSPHAAKTKSVTLAAQLDEEWFTLRWRQKDNPLRRLLGDAEYEPSRVYGIIFGGLPYYNFSHLSLLIIKYLLDFRA